MKLDIKKLLLAGTAIVAVGATAPTQASANAETLAGNVTWAVDANQNGAPADGTGAAANDAVNISTNTLTVLNTTANDGSGVGTYNLGAVTGTTGSLTVTSDAINVDLTANIASIALSGAGNFSVNTLDADNSTVAATVAGTTSIGGNLSVVSTEADAADTLTLTLTGNATIGGTTQLTAGGNVSGANATLNIDGASNTFTGAVTVDGGANAGADAYITVSGASTTFTGGLALDDNTGQAIATFDGATAQTVAGAITGVTDGDGAILVTNTSGGVTFTGTVGTAANSLASVTVAAADTNNTSATFKAGVDVTAIVLGNGTGTDTNTVTFDGTAAGYTVAGTLNGTAGDTDNVVVTGGNTITTSGIWGANSPVDALSITGTGTKLTAGADITATTVSIASGATLDADDKIIASGGITNAGTLDTGADLVTANIANTGTVLVSGTGGITGNITGAGTLDVNESATITGNVAGTSADVATGKTLTVAGANTYSVTTTSLTGTGAITFGGAAQTVSGAITAAATGNGTVNIADNAATVAFTNDIGTSTVKVGALVGANGGTAQTVSTTGNLYIDAITLDNDDSLQFLGTSAQVVSGTINATDTDTEGSIVVGNTAGTIASDVTFNGIIGGTANRQLEDLTVNDTAKATFAANATFDDALSADKATIAVKSGATLTANTQTDADITTWNIEVNRAGGDANNSTGKVVLAGDAVNLAVDTVHFDVKANSAPLKVGTAALDNVFAGNAAATIAGATVTDSSFIYGFTLVADTNNVDVTVAVDNSVESVTDNSGYDATGNQLITTLAASTNTEINQLQSTLAAASTQSAANDVIEAAGSDVAGGAVVAGVQVAGSTSAINNDRLASLRSGETGMNAGQVMHGLNAWIQGFGSQADQDKRDGVSGYDADTYGFAVGFDTQELAQDITVGLSFAYADTDVDSDAISKAKTEVDSYQVSLYGDYDLNETVFVSGQLGYIWSDNDTTRNPGGIAALSAKGSYNADAFVAGLAVGRDYHTGHGTLVLTPKVSADYMHYSADSYTETGAGGANLTVDADSLSLFEIGLGVEAEWDIQNANGTHLMPSIGLGVRHDLIGDEFEASNKFAGGGTAFKVKGFDPAQTTFDVGLGVKYITDTNWTLSAGYDFEFKSDYDSHAGMVKASYKF